MRVAQKSVIKFFLVAQLFYTSPEVFAAFGLDNHTNEDIRVCLVEADQTTVKWTWALCRRNDRVAFDAGKFYPNQTYWVVVVRPNGQSPIGASSNGGYINYFPTTADLPNGNRKINLGAPGVSSMIKNNDWSEFVRAVGTQTHHYNAIMMLRNGESPLVTHNNLVYGNGYEKGYGKVSTSDANYAWSDIFSKPVPGTTPNPPGPAPNNSTPLAAKYNDLGGATGILGPPVDGQPGTGERVLQAPWSGRFVRFQNGSVYWSPTTGAHEVHGLIRDKWSSLGWERSVLGFPTTDEMPTPDNVGRFNHFQGGSIYWTPQTGAHEVHGAIKEKWAKMGWERSYLGYPTSDEMDTPDGRGKRSTFQGGYIDWYLLKGASDHPN